MPEYLLELYAPTGGATGSGTAAARIRRAAEQVACDGGAVQYLRSIYVAADETCFVLLEADTLDAALQVARLADVASNRVSEVASEPAFPDRLHPAATEARS